MKFILVVDRRHLFPNLSPQGLLPLMAVDREIVERQAFFAERGYMEECSHYKQVIPYIALHLGEEILCYQRKVEHSEARLGGLWTVGFGGHIEPLDRAAPELKAVGLLEVAAVRELEEETGLAVPATLLEPRGWINSDAEAVSSVHLGLLYRVDLAGLGLDRESIAERVVAQAEPHRVEWRDMRSLRAPEGQLPEAPEGGRWEDWTRIALSALVNGD